MLARLAGPADRVQLPRPPPGRVPRASATAGAGERRPGGHWHPAPALAAGWAARSAPGMPAAHVLEVTALARETGAGPELVVSLAWPQGLLEQSEAAGLADGWVAALGGIAAHAGQPAAGGHTPSDFPLVAVTRP